MAEGQGNHAMPEMEDLLRPVSETIKHSMAEGQRNHAMPEMEYLLRAVSEPIDEIRRRLEENNVPYDKETLKSIFTGLDEKTQNKVKSCLEGIGKSIVKLSSNDPAKQMSGALDLVASVTVFIPTVGPIISGVCLLVSNVIIAFGAKPSGTNIAAELEHVLEKVIGKYHDDDVKAAAAGVSFKLRNMLTYLDGYTMTDPNAFPEEELVKLASHDLEYTNVGVECLGTLESYIKQYSVNKPSEDHDAVEHQARCALDYIDAYLELSVVRKLLLSLYYCILLSTGRFEATTNGVMRSIQLATEKVTYILVIKVQKA